MPSILAPPFLEGSESQDHLLCSCSVASVISDFLHPYGLSVTVSPNSPIMQSSAWPSNNALYFSWLSLHSSKMGTKKKKKRRERMLLLYIINLEWGHLGTFSKILRRELRGCWIQCPAMGVHWRPHTEVLDKAFSVKSWRLEVCWGSGGLFLSPDIWYLVLDGQRQEEHRSWLGKHPQGQDLVKDTRAR